MTRIEVLTGATVLAALVAAAPVQAAGDAAAGHALAQRWCTSCHVVDSATAGSDAAPAFSAIVNRAKRTPGTLRAWLAAPHPPMPNLSLSRREVDDIVAYLDSLRKS